MSQFAELFGRVFDECQKNGWPVREPGKTVKDKLIESIEFLFEFEEDDAEYNARIIYKDLVGLKHLQGEHYKIYQTCQAEFEKSVGNQMSSGREVNEEFLERLYSIINDAAMMHYMNKENRNRRGYSGDILIYINHLVREMVIRVPASKSGKPIIVPSPIGDIVVSQKELVDRGFGRILHLLEKVRNRQLLERTFEKHFYERMNRIGLWDKQRGLMDLEVVKYRDAMIYVILNDLAIDIVRGKAFLAEGHIMFHMRKKGEIEDSDELRGPGVWAGEYVLRELSKDQMHPILKAANRDSNLEAFAYILLEEVQHAIVPSGVTHDPLKIKEDGSANLWQVVDHDFETFMMPTFQLIRAIEEAHGLKDGEYAEKILKKIKGH